MAMKYTFYNEQVAIINVGNRYYPVVIVDEKNNYRYVNTPDGTPRNYSTKASAKRFIKNWLVD